MLPAGETSYSLQNMGVRRQSHHAPYYVNGWLSWASPNPRSARGLPAWGEADTQAVHVSLQVPLVASAGAQLGT